MTVNVLSLCHVRETSPGTHTFFPTYTCPVYCWRSVQLLDFGLYSSLIHASQPIRTTFTGQWFASGFLQTPPHGDALAIGCTLPTAGRVRDFHPLERAPAGRTTTKAAFPLQRKRLKTNHFLGIFPFCPGIYTSSDNMAGFLAYDLRSCRKRTSSQERMLPMTYCPFLRQSQ